MIRRFHPVLYAGMLFIGVPAFAQTGFHPTPTQQQTSPVANNTPSPEGMPGPGMPPGPNAAAEVCGGNFPDGGAPYFLTPETKENRQSRLGTNEDPGCTPDPKKVFQRFGQQYTIEQYNREWAVYTGGHDAYQIRPFGFVNAYKELYQQNDKYVWVWQRVPDPANAEPIAEDLQKSTQSNNRYSDGDIKYLQDIRSEFFELTPPESSKAVRFVESSEGLPTAGSWRNGLAVADMNGDGFPDIIAPPERAGGTGIPAIFLGDGKGHWKYWQEARWPHAFDYGTVAAGDFNKDGRMDLAFAVHLSGVYVVLGDGKGNFKEVSEGLPRDFPTRRLVVADVDRDGYPDIVAISEGPTGMNTSHPIGKVRVFYNRDHGRKFEAVDVATPQTRVGGDYLSVANLTGDKYPDVVAGSIYQGSPDIIYLNVGGKQWTKLDSKVGTVVPFLSFYLASAAGRFTSKKSDDVILSYVRFWPGDVNEKLIPRPPLTEVSGLDRVFYAGGEPKRAPIARWAGKFGITGVAAADIDGDGKLDIVYSTLRSADSREIGVLFGDGKGNFARGKLPGLSGERKASYDLRVADVNGDGRPDVIIMYEADQVTAFSPRNGSIHVFLNQGPEPVAKVADR